MKSKARITSILNAETLDGSITGLPAFHLSELDLVVDLDFELPTNLRLGHLVEAIVSRLIKGSTNYELLYENIQLIEEKKTVGEIDFIIKNKNNHQLTHLELAYKFYLYDPAISSVPLHNWIGPNRNDSLVRKLKKTTDKQFPLLYHDIAKIRFSDIAIDKVTQALCLIASLFIPYKSKIAFSPLFEKAIKGYYLDFENFASIDHSQKTYYLPTKKEWGMDPAENEIWVDFATLENEVIHRMKEHKAVLCWENQQERYSTFFVVWW